MGVARGDVSDGGGVSVANLVTGAAAMAASLNSGGCDGSHGHDSVAKRTSMMIWPVCSAFAAKSVEITCTNHESPSGPTTRRGSASAIMSTHLSCAVPVGHVTCTASRSEYHV